MNNSPRYSPDTHADVCLLLEGTYPYVRGGVSTWVKQLIEGMPELKFSIVFLGGSPDEYDEPAYQIPDNIVHIEMHFLIGSEDEAPKKKKLFAKKANKTAQFARNSELHEQLRASQTAGTGVDPSTIKDFTSMISGENAITLSDLSHSDNAWHAIRERYVDAPPGLDFNHFFWSVKTMHGPLFTLANIVENAPSASLYHSVSTGYAGYLGATLQSKTGTPYIISEHGIYTKEREIDLAHVDWIPEEYDPFRVGLDDSMGYLRQTWIRFFRSLGKLSYSSADHIYTLYNGNRLRQIEDGAPESKLTIIPNGVSVVIGRIVPIKDIKTFIRAMRIIRAKVPDAQGWLVGPEEEDPDYVSECKALVESFGLEDAVTFKGFQKLTDVFPQIGLTVLTSVSEGQPLTTLEGFAAGIPSVTTDVGSCSELIYGNTEEDRAIGAAGSVVPLANPTAFAEAVIPLLSDTKQWKAARDAAIQRVEKYYDEKDMLKRYHNIYLDQIQSAQPLKRAGGQ